MILFLYLFHLYFFIILFYFILFYFILFYFILFYFILFYFILFYFILYYIILYYIILVYVFVLFFLTQDSGTIWRYLAAFDFVSHCWLIMFLILFAQLFPLSSPLSPLPLSFLFEKQVFIDVRDERMLVGIVLSDHKKFMLRDYVEYGTTKLRTSVANALGRYA